MLKPHVDKLVVCNPRKNALLKDGNKSDRIDAHKLADRLRLDDLKPVYHGETGVRTLRELARSYLTIIFGSFLPSLLVGSAPPTLLGHRSRHCHGINFTDNRSIKGNVKGNSSPSTGGEEDFLGFQSL